MMSRSLHQGEHDPWEKAQGIDINDEGITTCMSRWARWAPVVVTVVGPGCRFGGGYRCGGRGVAKTVSKEQKENNSVQRATDAEGWQQDQHGESRISRVESAGCERQYDNMLCDGCRSIVGGWLFWWARVGGVSVRIPVVRALHLVAAGYLQQANDAHDLSG